MARVEVYEISNISNQLVTFGYSRIKASLSIGVVEPRDEGILKLASGSSISIEAQRVERGELEEIQNLGLIRFQTRFVQRPDAPSAPCFDLEVKNYFVGFPIVIEPQDVEGPVAYWSAPELPTPLSLDPVTGIITAPNPTIPYSVDFYVSAVGPDNLACTRNYTLNVIPPGIIDLDITTAFFLQLNNYAFRDNTLLNAWVDWGDGSAPEYIDLSTARNPLLHDYPSVGTFNLRFFGEFDRYGTSSPILFDVWTEAINDITSDDIVALGFANFFQPLALNTAQFNTPNLTSVEDLFDSNFQNLAPIPFPVALLDQATGLTNLNRAFVANPTFTTQPPANWFDRFPLLEEADATFAANAFTGPLPTDPFANNPNLRSCFGTFGNNNYTGTIPPNFFASNPLLENAGGCFSDNAGITGSIPNTLYANNPMLRNVQGAFQSCVGLTGSIPSDLFDNNPLLEDARSAFSITTGITGAIPSSLFDNNPNLEIVDTIFAQSGVSGSIPGALFANNPNLRSAQEIFFGAPNLTGTIPATIFANNPILDTASFGRLIGVTGTIPGNLFANNPVLRNVDSLFEASTALTGNIPSTLFANNPLLEIVRYAFAQMGTFGSIPSDLFDNNPLLADCAFTFSNTNFTGGIPNNLFANNQNLGFIGHVFSSVPITTLTPAIFGGTVKPNVFAIEALNAFNGSLTSVGAGLLDLFPNNVTCRNLFNFCNSGALTTLPLGFWDSQTLVTEYSGTFNATFFNAATFDDYLTSVDANNVATGFRAMNYSGSASGGHLDASRSPAALTAKANLVTNGWVITGAY